MSQALSRQAEVSTVGMQAREIFGKLEPRDDSLGLEHELLLWDRRPELWHRWHSWRQLRRFYLEKTARHGAPDVCPGEESRARSTAVLCAGCAGNIPVR